MELRLAIFTQKVVLFSFSLETFFLQTCDRSLRTNFQNELNQSYDKREGFDDVKVRAFDVCGVLHNGDFVRGEVMQLVSIGNKITCELFLIDYGYRIIVETSKLYLLKFEHASVEPFSLEFQLSILNNDEKDFSDTMKEELMQRFKKLAESTDQILIYFNELVPGTYDKYDVILLTDDSTENTYLLSESYAAFNCKKIEFDDEICRDWFMSLVYEPLNLETDSKLNTKKLVEISHIVSLMEIYVRHTKGTKRMPQIRQEINSHVRSAKPRVSTNWSLGDACLVIQQNPLIDSKMMSWYRGRILAENTIAHSYEVFMCDYGYKVHAKESELMTIPENLASYEDSVTFCCLDIPNILSIESSTAIAQLYDLIRNYTKLAVSFSDYISVVTLWGSNAPGMIEWDHDWDDLNVKFMSRMIKQSMQNFITKTQREYKCGFIHEELFNECQMVMECVGGDSADLTFGNQTIPKHIDKWDLPKRLDSTRLQGIVTYIDQSGTIFVQLEPDYETAKSLEISIANYVTGKQRCAKDHVWRKANTCFALHGKYFRRAIIKRIDQEKGICQVTTIHFISCNYYID